MSIGQQIGELFLQAVPIVLILLVFYAILHGLFFGPLLKVMAEREARTQGAQKAAETAQGAASDKVKQYQEALKQARAKLYAEQEAARKTLLDERAARLKDARAHAATTVGTAKQQIASELMAATRELETNIVPLSAEIARRMLSGSQQPSAPAGDAR